MLDFEKVVPQKLDNSHATSNKKKTKRKNVLKQLRNHDITKMAAILYFSRHVGF
jgi:hypothetical protein